jgi:peptidoglycan/LPS O-acetylase OafA/YrhL
MEAGMRSAPKGYIPALTGLRGIAALWVVLLHSREFMGDMLGRDLRYAPLLKDGYFGVDIFFILSGFIIAYVHLEDFSRFTGENLKRFAVLRFFRVYPLHWLVLSWLLFLTAACPGYADFVKNWMHNPGQFSFRSFLISALLVEHWGYNFGHPANWVAWTLSAEILAYMLFPLLAFMMLRLQSERLSLWLAAGMLLALGGIMGVSGGIDRISIDRGGLVRMAFEFPAGMFLCRYVRLSRRRDSRRLGVAGLLLLCLCLMIPACKPLIYTAFGLLILALATPGDRLKPVMESRAVLWLGNISFSLYLTHYIILMLAHWLLKPYLPLHVPMLWLAVMNLCLMLCFGAAYLFHRFAERPFQKWGRRFAAHIPDHPKPMIAVTA